MASELRISLVLYGGSSLAVYISGVVAEISNLVLATSGATDIDPKSTAAIYRKHFGQGSSEPIRIVVDVVAGSSAGGINAIFLGKALAQGFELSSLEQVWVDVGDLDGLLNEASRTESSDETPLSLLDGDLMLETLIDRLDRFDQIAPGTPLVDEVTVQVTATDYYGLNDPLPAPLGSIIEKNHRQVMRFSFNDKTNDFTAANHGRLAFAARATAAFPFAFNPATWDHSGDRLDKQSLDSKIYPDYSSEPFRARPLVDGGGIDNKPLGLVLRGNPAREATLDQVKRTVIFVEPQPMPLSAGSTDEVMPGPFVNIARVLMLGRYEPIRGDLEDLEKWNANQDELAAMLELSNQALAYTIGQQSVFDWPELGARPDGTPAWRCHQFPLAVAGPSYGSYHKRKVESVNRRLAEELRQIAPPRLRPQLDHELDWWFNSSFKPLLADIEAPVPLDSGFNEGEFLLRYDIDYRKRRLRFLTRTIRSVVSHDPSIEPLTTRWAQHYGAPLGANDHRELRLLHAAITAHTKWLTDALDKAHSQFLATVRQADSGESNGSGFEAIEAANLVSQELDSIARRLAPILIESAGRTRNNRGAILNAGSVASEFLSWIYDAYDRYDIQVFPFGDAYFADTGRIDVHRISPEVDTGFGLKARRPLAKLAGVPLAKFGGFLHEDRRRNDFMWGRIDASQRMIELCGGGVRIADEVEAAILSTQLGPDSWLRKAHDSVTDVESARAYLSSDAYEPPTGLTPETAGPLIDRVTTMIGRMLNSSAKRAGSFRAVTRIVSWLNGLAPKRWALAVAALVPMAAVFAAPAPLSAELKTVVFCLQIAVSIWVSWMAKRHVPSLGLQRGPGQAVVGLAWLASAVWIGLTVLWVTGESAWVLSAAATLGAIGAGTMAILTGIAFWIADTIKGYEVKFVKSLSSR